MQERLDRLQDRASKRRQIAKDVMVDLDLKKITAPDFTVSIRPGLPALWCSMRRRCPASIGSRVAPRLETSGTTERTQRGRTKSRALPSPTQSPF